MAINFFSKKIEKNVPKIKKGAKGSGDFKFFLPVKIKKEPIIAPLNMAKRRAKTIFGNER